MNLNNKKAILFDLDGTLIDSVPDLAHAVNYMLKSLGKETYPENTIRYWVGNGAATLVKRALLGKKDIEEFTDFELFEQAQSLFFDHYTQHLADTTILYNRVQETLKHLHNNYQLAIITNKPFRFVEPILTQLGVNQYFSHILGGDSLDTKKPDPTPLFHMCELLKLDIKECVMVGDSKNDIIAASKASMDSIAVTYGYNYGEDINQYKPTFVIDDFSKISGIVHG
jgi:phosphoglycolate phosphatase